MTTLDKQFELRMEQRPIRLISLSGSAGCGKSVVAEMIDNELDSWQIKAFSGKLKEIAGIMLDVDHRKFEDREFKNSTLDPKWDYEVFYGNCREPEFTCFEPMTIRKFLQKLGTDAIRRGLHENTWINLLFKDFDSREPYTFLAKDDMVYADDTQRWVICDARFANEIAEVKRRGGICVRIDRPDFGGKDLHPSENEWKDLPFDFVISNDSDLPSLQIKVKEVLTKLDLI